MIYDNNEDDELPNEALPTLFLHNKGISELPICQFKFITIRKLFLQNNYLQDLKGLDSLPLLRYLDVSFNHIHIINGLQHCHVLEELIADQQITSNEYTINIDPRSAQTLKNCLIKFHCAGNNVDQLRNIVMLKNLKHLDLSCNNIDNLIKLTNDLKNLKNLKTLNLFENKVTKQERYIRNIIGKLPKLEELDSKKISPSLRYHCMMKLKTSDGKSSSNKLTLFKHLSNLCDPLPYAVKEGLLKTVIENNKNYVP